MTKMSNFARLFHSVTMRREGLPIQFLRLAVTGGRVGLLQFANDEVQLESLQFSHDDISDLAIPKLSLRVFTSTPTTSPI